MTKTRTGRCGCGQLSFTADDDPIIVHACHCTYCQRESGSVHGLNFVIEAEKVELTGEVETIDTPSHSGKGQWILRCPTCKVAVSSHYQSAREAMHFLRCGAFDDKSGIRPDAHIFTAEKFDYLHLDEDIPAFEHFYDPREFWTDEQRARWKKAMGK